MGRPVMLSNGQLLVGLDERGLVHDFYYPYVGLDNLTTAHSVHHKIGVWVKNKFSWVDEDGWDIKVDFDSDALVSDISMESSKLGVRLQFSDFVDCQHNSLIRRINVTNTTETHSDVRLFMHQVFQISRAGRADTALFVPDTNYILDYKGRDALLIYGQTDDKVPFDQYAVGNYAIEGKEGTYIDAEDGELSGNAVEHGGVDSVIRFKLDLNSGQTKQIQYWIIASESQYEAEQIHKSYIKEGAEYREKLVREYWQKWLSIGADSLHALDKKYQNFTKKSLMIIKAHTDKRGGILASGDSSIFNYGRDYYCYCWPRDGAYSVWPLIRMGYVEEPKNFFEFFRDTLNHNGYLMHKYQPDRSIGSTWHPLIHDNHAELAIQEDETAIIICMLGEFYDHSKESEFIESLYSTLIKPAADFMSEFIDPETNLPHASYDIWEEKFLTTTYTCSMVEHALLRASKFADIFEYPDDAIYWKETAQKISKASKILYEPDMGYYRKGFHLQPDGSLHFDDTIDASSMYGAFMFKSQPEGSEMIVKTVKKVEEHLTNHGRYDGITRYENDCYMMRENNQLSNPWFVCSLWLAQYYIQTKQYDKARKKLDWTMSLSYPSGILSEQINPVDGRPIGVAPLVWSHAEFINTALDLANE